MYEISIFLFGGCLGFLTGLWLKPILDKADAADETTNDSNTSAKD